MEHVTIAAMRALVERSTFGGYKQRQEAKRELVEALRATGYKRGDACKMVNTWTAERWREFTVTHGNATRCNTVDTWIVERLHKSDLETSAQNQDAAQGWSDSCKGEPS